MAMPLNKHSCSIKELNGNSRTLLHHRLKGDLNFFIAALIAAVSESVREVVELDWVLT